MVWSSDSRQLLVQIAGEADSGVTLVLDTTKEVGDLGRAGLPVPGLQPREWISRMVSVDAGVFVAIHCCREPTSSLGSQESTQYGVVGVSGQLRRITTTHDPLELVIAVDPSASYILLGNGSTKRITRADTDGSNRVALDAAFANILWQ
jgi:hypothetical protein